MHISPRTFSEYLEDFVASSEPSVNKFCINHLAFVEGVRKHNGGKAPAAYSKSALQAKHRGSSNKVNLADPKVLFLIGYIEFDGILHGFMTEFPDGLVDVKHKAIASRIETLRSKDESGEAIEGRPNTSSKLITDAWSSVRGRTFLYAFSMVSPPSIGRPLNKEFTNIVGHYRVSNTDIPDVVDAEAFLVKSKSDGDGYLRPEFHSKWSSDGPIFVGGPSRYIIKFILKRGGQRSVSGLLDLQQHKIHPLVRDSETNESLSYCGDIINLTNEEVGVSNFVYAIDITDEDENLDPIINKWTDQLLKQVSNLTE